jgi:hypothetical protein
MVGLIDFLLGPLEFGAWSGLPDEEKKQMMTKIQVTADKAAFYTANLLTELNAWPVDGKNNSGDGEGGGGDTYGTTTAGTVGGGNENATQQLMGRSLKMPHVGERGVFQCFGTALTQEQEQGF